MESLALRVEKNGSEEIEQRDCEIVGETIHTLPRSRSIQRFQQHFLALLDLIVKSQSTTRTKDTYFFSIEDSAPNAVTVL